MRQSGASLPCRTESWRSSPQNGQRIVAVEVVDLAVGLEMLLQPALAVGDRLGEILEPQRGHGLALAAQAPRATAAQPAAAAGARRPDTSKGVRHGRRTAPPPRSRPGSPSRISVAVSSGTGMHLERHLAHDRQRAPAARQAAAQVEAGDVLHHAAAGLEDLAAAVDRPHAQQVVARRADADAPRAGQVGGEDAADGGLRRPRRRRAARKLDRLERQHLPARGERVLDLRQRRAGARRHHHLARLVERDAAQALGRHAGRRVHRPADAAAWSRRPPASSGVVVAVASASTRENSRSSTGRMLAEHGHGSPHAASGVAGLAAIERKHLGRVQQPLRVEHGLDAHLHVEVGLGELRRASGRASRCRRRARR